MRLIDADALLSELNNLEVNCKNKYVKQGIDDGLHYYMPRILENEPTIDAVPVVRCRDCKHWNNACCGLGTGDCHVLERITFETFFCSYGERKENNND